MKLSYLFLVVVMFSMTACARGMIHVDAMTPTLAPVMARHDAYVLADPALSPEDKATYLRSTELLRGVVAEAQDVGLAPVE